MKMNTAVAVNKQPSNGVKHGPAVTENDADDNISYVDSDTHAQSFCCCIHGWKNGADPRWYYPWDKGMYRLLGVACMWYCLCTFVPCILCNRTARSIVCCEGQCTESRTRRHSDTETESKDGVAEA